MAAADPALPHTLLEAALYEASSSVEAACGAHFRHGRAALLGIVALMVVRALAVWRGELPGYCVVGMHAVAFFVDLFCAVFALPLFVRATRAHCVGIGCLGPVMTLVFTMCLVDAMALATFLITATPRPLAPGSRSYVEVMQAVVGVWDFVLLASVALEAALCASIWRVYKELRLAGLYPSGSGPPTPVKADEVSLLELVCEAEDVKTLRALQCASPCLGGAGAQGELALVEAV